MFFGHVLNSISIVIVRGETSQRLETCTVLFLRGKRIFCMSSLRNWMIISSWARPPGAGDSWVHGRKKLCLKINSLIKVKCILLIKCIGYIRNHKFNACLASLFGLIFSEEVAHPSRQSYIKWRASHLLLIVIISRG